MLAAYRGLGILNSQPAIIFVTDKNIIEKTTTKINKGGEKEGRTKG